MEEISIIKKFFRVVPPRLMQIVSFIEQFDGLKNMSTEEFFDQLKLHEERLHADDREEEKYILLTHEE